MVAQRPPKHTIIYIYIYIYNCADAVLPSVRVAVELGTDSRHVCAVNYV